jgi:hypothetical protein
MLLRCILTTKTLPTSKRHSGGRLHVSVLTVTCEFRLQALRRARLSSISIRPQECILTSRVNNLDVSSELQRPAAGKTTAAFHAQTENITIDRSISASRSDIVYSSKDLFCTHGEITSCNLSKGTRDSKNLAQS